MLVRSTSSMWTQASLSDLDVVRLGCAKVWDAQRRQLSEEGTCSRQSGRSRRSAVTWS